MTIVRRIALSLNNEVMVIEYLPVPVIFSGSAAGVVPRGAWLGR